MNGALQYEIFDHSVPPVETPADVPHELPASPVPAFRRSPIYSPSFRLANIFTPSRSNKPSIQCQPPIGQYGAKHHPARSPRASTSRIQPTSSQASISSPSAAEFRMSQSPDQSEPSSLREHESFSLISPIGGSDDSTDHQGLFSRVKGFAEPVRPPSSLSRRHGHQEPS